ncbi:calcium/calmodulin-dependent protein kinase kinase [Pycnococcus provasolii]
MGCCTSTPSTSSGDGNGRQGGGRNWSFSFTSADKVDVVVDGSSENNNNSNNNRRRRNSREYKSSLSRKGSRASTDTPKTISFLVSSNPTTPSSQMSLNEARAEVLKMMMNADDVGDDDDDDDDENSEEEKSRVQRHSQLRANLLKIHDMEESLLSGEPHAYQNNKSFTSSIGSYGSQDLESLAISGLDKLDSTMGGDEIVETHEVKETKTGTYKHNQLNQYISIKSLGRGSFGEVKLGMDSNTGRMYALKVMGGMKAAGDASGAVYDSLRKEVAVMKKVRHPNCVKLFEVIEDTAESKMVLVIEYVPGGALSCLFHTSGDEPVDPLELCLIMRGCCAGAEFLHSNDIVHRDIKPENLIKTTVGPLARTGGTVKLADFGVSAITGKSGKIVDTAGSPAFMAPETVSLGDFDAYVSDVWSVGITIWNFVYCDLPFTGRTQFVVYKKIREEEVKISTTNCRGDAVREDVLELMQALLTKDPSKRPKMRNVLSHRFLQFDGKYDPLVPTAASMLITVSGKELLRAIKNDVLTVDEATTTTEKFAPGECLVKQGDRGDGKMYFIESGEAEVFVSVDGEEVFVASRTKGDFIGEAALFSGDDVRTATVRAKTDLVALVANRSDVDKFMTKERRGSISEVIELRNQEMRSAITRSKSEVPENLRREKTEVDRLHRSFTAPSEGTSSATSTTMTTKDDSETKSRKQRPPLPGAFNSSSSLIIDDFGNVKDREPTNALN